MAIIRHIHAENFRGIRSLDWHVGGRIVCLVGPGDSCKTSILDAIEYGLSPRWSLMLSDADFYQADTTRTIVIELTIGELPEALFAEDKCGLYLRGYDPAGTIKDDPDDTTESVLTIRLRIDRDFDPQWTLVKASNPETRTIGNRDREAIATARLGDDAERHLTWGRGSALSKLTEENSAAGAVVLAHNAAKTAIAAAPLNELQEVVRRVQQSIGEYGVTAAALKPGLDMEGMKLGQAAISLHDQVLPLRVVGLGSRRLAALAVQQTGTGNHAISLIDEVEHGLEPHRIRQVLKKLCDGHRQIEGNPAPAGQVIMTTHSPTPIMALDISEIQFVRCDQGAVTVSKADAASVDQLQPLARTLPHAFLARRLIVCEGKTEEALCRALDDFWARTHNNLPFGYFGVAAVVGGGTQASTVALALRRLNYEVLYFGDSDWPLNPDEQALRDAGIEVVLWPGNMRTEARLALDLRMDDLQRMVDVAVEIFGDQQVLNGFTTVIGQNANPLGTRLADWLARGRDEAATRNAVGEAAATTLGGWFKNINAGVRLGQIVADALPAIPGAPASATIKRVEDWVYGQ